jgi:hypothetical protein
MTTRHAGSTGADGEGDAVDCGEQRDRRHYGRTDLNDYPRGVRQHRIGDLANEAC